MGHPSMPRWRYTVLRPCPYISCNMHRKYNTNFINSNKKEAFFYKRPLFLYKNRLFHRLHLPNGTN